MKIGLASCVLWIVYFVLLGSRAAVFTSSLSLCRQVAGVYFSDFWMRVTTSVALILVGAFLLIQGTGWVSMLPIGAALARTASVWMRGWPIRFRLSNICGEFAFIAYAIAIEAQALLVSAIIVVAMNLDCAGKKA